jgi:hypothetical protein
MNADESSQLPESEDWTELYRRISVPGRLNEISLAAYRYFLETFRPLLYGGNRFCIADGLDALRLFWSTNGRYFCRQLNREETGCLCDASGLSRDYRV